MVDDSVAFMRDRLPATPPTRRHDALVRLQRADGSWRLTGRLLDEIGLERERLVWSVAFIGGGAKAEAIVATLAAIAFLEMDVAEYEDEWSSLAAKAERWVEVALAAMGMEGAFEPLHEEVYDLIRGRRE